ncbi:MAG: 50S ribosomal protein L25 [Dehalococcoidia bacterium]|nr:50S ribosomal protein L25 [Dehalococcoidia bacterium]MSQ34259.1 50S ribosomal protein L25 [Dehalococcoidia bacterium]
MDQITLAATTREAMGKKNGALRRSGGLPLHVYGLKGDSLSIQAPLSEVRAILRTAGRTTPVRVTVDGSGDTVTLIREVTRHPVSGVILHVDLLRVDPDQPIEVRVPIRLINVSSAPGTRGGAGVVTQGMYDVPVRAKPYDIPKELVADCMRLESFDTAITLGNLGYPPGVEPAGSPDTNVAWIQAPRVTKVEEPVAAAAGEVAAEGEATAEGAPGAKGAAPAAGAKGAAPAAGAKGAAPAAGGAAAKKG